MWRVVLFLSAVIIFFGISCPGELLARDFADIFLDGEAPWLGQGETEAADEVGQEEQEEEELETDRDSFTPATTTVGTGRVLFESSYSFLQNRNTENTNSFPEIITRFGITERLEFRLGWNYETGGGGSISSGDAGEATEEPGSRQESQLLYGFKYQTTKQKSWIPQSAVIVQASPPTSGPETYSDLQLGYVFGWTMRNDWRIDSSVRYINTKQEGDHFNQWAPSVVLRIPVADRWSMHGEYFGIFTDGQSQGSNPQYFSPGAHYLVSPNCEIGVRVGWGLNQDAANFFSNVGLGLRF